MLDKEELEATRKLNGADTKIILDSRFIDEKVEELEKWIKLKKSEYDNEQYAYIRGQIMTLRAIRNGDLSKI